MNDKLCKILRQRAEEKTNGYVPKEYVIDDRGTRHLVLGCTRAVYRKMKLAIKRREIESET